MTSYRFTVRPPSADHCPPGWTSMAANPEPARFNHGTVEYPEPLPADVADHWSLRPVGPDLPSVVWEGETYECAALFGSVASELAYSFRCGLIAPSAVEAAIHAAAADYDVSVKIIWPTTCAPDTDGVR